MLYLVNDTSISILEKADSSSQGGTSAYLGGFINFLLNKKIEFGLIGNFEIKDKSARNAYISHPATNLAFLKYLFNLFLRKKFSQNDILYFQRPDQLACSIFGKKIRILHLHGQQRTTIIKNRNLIVKVFYLILERIGMHMANLVLVTDKKTASVYLKHYPFIAKKIKIVPTGIDLTFFADSTGIPSKEKTTLSRELVYIGRLAPPKKVLDMLQAFKIVSGTNANSHFSIAGKGSLKNSIQQSVIDMELEDKVSFVGVLSKDEVRKLIHNCDAAILLSGNEGSPISVKEILACGKPVIVNDVGDLTEYVIEGKNGYIVNPDNHPEVAAAITKAFANGDNMRESCITSMLPFDELLINQTIVNHIFNRKANN
ncbi:MAG: glycosyltransferase family 4 protein [Bacteroidales bacterium]